MTAGSMDDLSIQGLSYVRYPVEKMPSKKLNFEEANSIRLNRNTDQKRRASELKVRLTFLIFFEKGFDQCSFLTSKVVSTEIWAHFWISSLSWQLVKDDNSFRFYFLKESVTEAWESDTSDSNCCGNSKWNSCFSFSRTWALMMKNFIKMFRNPV